MSGKSRNKAEAGEDKTVNQAEPSPADAEKIRAYEKMAGPEPSAAEKAPAAEADGSQASGDVDPDTALEAAKNEASQNYDRYVRLSAEFENFKKRSAREKEDFRKYAVESLIKEMLPVVDNLERAIFSASEDKAADGIVQGVRMTLDELLKVFDKAKVKPIDALGKTFDPAVHQAVLQEETDAHPDKTVIREFQKGYTIHGRLLRPAMVVVAKGGQGAEGDGPETAS